MSLRSLFRHSFLLFALGTSAIVLVLYIALVRDGDYKPSYELRSKVGAAGLQKGFTVALVWPKEDIPSFFDGVRLAWEELNASQSPIAGKIHLKRFVEKPGESGTRLAEQVARDHDVVAVLGHKTSASAVPASLVYEEKGILFLTPTATDPRLTTHGFRYVFRLTPDNRENAAALVRFAKRQGYKRIGVLYARTEYGDSLAPFFVSAATDAGIQIAFYKSYLPTEQDFRPMIAGVREESFDAVMIADQVRRAGRLIRDLARMGVRQPILGSDKMDSDLLWDVSGSASNNVYVASADDPSTVNARFEDFKRRFRKRFGAAPDYDATQGYSALMLLADAVLASGTADPLIVATTLHCSRPWKGFFGNFSFDDEGDVLGREIFIKHMDNGSLNTVALLKENGRS
ncbi:MAG TPA: ABC transporter substrate-binding protein [Bryobacteraceae bacterium]